MYRICSREGIIENVSSPSFLSFFFQKYESLFSNSIFAVESVSSIVWNTVLIPQSLRDEEEDHKQRHGHKHKGVQANQFD